MSLTVTALGASALAAATTVPITCAAAVPVGALVTVEMVSSTNSLTAGQPKCADSQGNTWTQTSAPDNPGTAFMVTEFHSIITNPLSTSDTITAFSTNAVSANLLARATSFVAPHGFIGSSATVMDKATKNEPAGATAMSCAATGALAQTDELVIAMFASAGTGNTFTKAAAFTLNPNASPSNASEIVWSEYTETSSNGAQTPTATQSAANSYAALCVTFKIASDPNLRFDPTTIPNLNFWYAADSLALADAAAIASWPDKGPGAFTLSQATGADQPTFNVNQINGLPAATFNGTTDFLSSGADASYGATGLTVFAVVKCTDLAHDQGILGCSNGAGLEFRLTNTSGTAGTPQANEANVASIGIATNVVIVNTWVILVFDYTNTSGGAWHHFKNGAANGNGTSTSVLAAGQTLNVGTKYSNSEFFFGQIAEVLSYERVLSTTERAQIDSYLQDRYGIVVVDYIPGPPTFLPRAMPKGV